MQGFVEKWRVQDGVSKPLQTPQKAGDTQPYHCDFPACLLYTSTDRAADYQKAAGRKKLGVTAK